MRQILSRGFSLLLFMLPFSALAEEDDNVSIESHTQQTAGIATARLEERSYRAETVAYGKVLSIESLLMMRQNYLTALAQQQSAHAKYNEAQSNLSRLQALHQQAIISTRRLQEQQAQTQGEQAQYAASGYQNEMIADSARLTWGKTVTDWFIQPNHPVAESLINHRLQLVEIILPANQQLEPDIRHIAVSANSERQQAQSAELITQAPTADPVTQGLRYFFKTTAGKLQPGIHLTAWIPGQTQARKGVMIPKPAVVWHLGQPWVFVKTATAQFNQRAVSAYQETGDGYFVLQGFKAGEEIAITGAQTLLSQAFKAQIPDEDDD